MANYKNDDENDAGGNDDRYSIPVAESQEATKFVNNFIYCEAMRDINNNRNVDVAEEIVREVNVSKCRENIEINEMMRTISDEFNQEIDALVLEALRSNIVDNFKDGYEKFVEIAHGVFDGGFTLSRLVVLIVFGYRWIVASCQRSNGAIATIIKYLVTFLSSGWVLRAVSNLGGWSAISQSLSLWASAIFFVVGLGFIALAFILKKS